jgi:hypothetical protein
MSNVISKKSTITDDICPSLNTLVVIVNKSIDEVISSIKEILKRNTTNPAVDEVEVIKSQIIRAARNIKDSIFENSFKIRLANLLKSKHWNTLNSGEKRQILKDLEKFNSSISKFNRLTDVGNPNTGEFNALIYNYTHLFLEMIFPPEIDVSLSINEKKRLILSSLTKRRSNLSQEFLEMYEIQKEILINESYTNQQTNNINGMTNQQNLIFNKITEKLYQCSKENKETSPLSNPDTKIPYFMLEDVFNEVPNITDGLKNDLQNMIISCGMVLYSFPGGLNAYSFTIDTLELLSLPEIGLFEKITSSPSDLYKFKFSTNTLNQLYLVTLILEKDNLSNELIKNICIKIASFIYFKILRRLIYQDNTFYPILKDPLFYEKFLAYIAKMVALIINRNWSNIFPFNRTSINKLNLKSDLNVPFLDLSFLDGILVIDPSLNKKEWEDLIYAFDKKLLPSVSATHSQNPKTQTFLNLFSKDGLFKLILMMKGEFFELYIENMIDLYFPWRDSEYLTLDTFYKLYDIEFIKEIEKSIVGNNYDIEQSNDLDELTSILTNLQSIRLNGNVIEFPNGIHPKIENDLSDYGLYKSGNDIRLEPTYENLILSNLDKILVNHAIILVQLTKVSLNRDNLTSDYHKLLAQRIIQYFLYKVTLEISSNHPNTEDLEWDSFKTIFNSRDLKPSNNNDYDYVEIIMLLISQKICNNNWDPVIDALLY